MHQGLTLIAGYISVLLRCFPSEADDIRLRLFQQDLSVPPEPPTSVIMLLWKLIRQSKVFKAGLSDFNSTVEMLGDYMSGSTASPITALSPSEQEWRMIIPFLELYTFVLRISDDEDFLSGLDRDDPAYQKQQLIPTRLRSCNLSTADVANLSLWLKSLAFALHYKPQLLAPSQSSQEYPVTDGRITNAAVGRPDVGQVRELITSTLRMLYDRDSRLQFFGSQHWLLSELPTHTFVDEVVEEEWKRQQHEDESDDESGEDNTQTDRDDNGTSYGIVTSRATADIIRRARIERDRSRVIPNAAPKRPSPMLEGARAILRFMPFAISFEARVGIFKKFMQMDKATRRRGLDDVGLWRFISGSHAHKNHAIIKRGQVLNDAYSHFWPLGADIKDPISISFLDQFGNEEAGIDGGGVTKEFLHSVIQEAFGPDQRLFVSNKQGLFYPNPSALDEKRTWLREQSYLDGTPEFAQGLEDLLHRYEFLGRNVGKCMYEGILIDVAFANFFLLKWSATRTSGEGSYKGSINDLRDMDEDLYQGMLKVKNHPGNVADWGIDFTIEDEVSPPGEPVRTVSRLLIPRGDTITVTNDNRLLYMYNVARHRLVSQPRRQTDAFLRGLRAIVHPAWLAMFNQSELQRLVGGDSREIDVDDLRANTVYSGIYTVGDDQREHPTVEIFWSVMRDFSDAERRDVLRYVTATPRAPLLGFAHLRPRFHIRDSGSDEARLPSASTCVNLLKLPVYKDRETLRSKLSLAVSSGAGFELS